MKVSFQKPPTPPTAPPVPAAPQTTTETLPNGAVSETTVASSVPGAQAPVVAAVPAADQGTAVYTPPPPAFDDSEDTFDPGDLVLPRLNIVQKVGDMSNVFPPGTIVLNGSLVLAPAGKEMATSGPIRFVVLGLQPTYFAEKVEGGARGDTYRHESEVVAAGGTLDWNESKRTEKPLYQRVSTGLLLIEQPAGIDPAAFPHSIEGKNYALALYTMKGVAYTNAARHFKSAKKIGWLRELGYRGGFWTFQSKLEKYGANFAYRPVLGQAEGTTPALRAATLAILGF